MPRSLGRYEILGSLARGGMATVYLGRHSGEAGFQRLYAIKVLHSHLADSGGFVNMLLDEARIAARLHHPNVVPIVDLGSQDGFHFVVLEYVEGCALSHLLSRNRESRPPKLLASIVCDVLSGLHAAHTLTDDDGLPMNLVHRDVSPQNILVGTDGTARLIDFGIAKAEARINSTRPGEVKGKFAYMAPEQLTNATEVDCRSDVFSAGVVLWSALTGMRLFVANTDAATMHNILHLDVPKPSTVGLKPPQLFDAICLKALERDPDRRFGSAAEMEEALREAASTASLFAPKRDIAQWVFTSMGKELQDRRAAIRAAAGGSSPDVERAVTATTGVSGTREVRDIPQLGSMTPSGRSLGDVSTDSADSVAAALAATQMRRWQIAAIAASAAVVAVLLVIWMQRPSAPPAAPSAEAAALTTAAAPATPPVTPPATAPVPVAAQTVAPTSSQAVAPPTGMATREPPSQHASFRRSSPPQSKPPATVAPPPQQPTPPSADQKKKPWDNDSPLPP